MRVIASFHAEIGVNGGVQLIAGYAVAGYAAKVGRNVVDSFLN